jgi:hypothetical protein
MNRWLVAILRVLLILQAAGAVAAVVALSLLLLLEVALGAYMIALFLLVAWVFLWSAIGATLFGQWRIGRRDGRWWCVMTGLQAVVVLTGIALVAYLLIPTQAGEPPPPTRNVVLVLVLPIVAVVNLALLAAIRASDHGT